MSDHVLIAVIATLGALLQFGGLVILGLQLREARKDSREIVEQGQRHAALLKAIIDHLAYLRTRVNAENP